MHQKRVQKTGGASGWAGIGENSSVDMQETSEENPQADKKDREIKKIDGWKERKKEE